MIGTGDLVMVVHSHCDQGYAVDGGRVFTVGVLRTFDGDMWRCAYCHYFVPMPAEVTFAGPSADRNGWPVSWLKKIEPLKEAERVETHEPVTV